MSKVSLPDLWMDIHNQDGETADECYRRYLFPERHEVSDVKCWDEQFEQAMDENEQIASQTRHETLERFERDEGETP